MKTFMFWLQLNTYYLFHAYNLRMLLMNQNLEIYSDLQSFQVVLQISTSDWKRQIIP